MFQTTLSASVSIPGHQTFCRSSCLVRTIPWWFSWAKERVQGRRLSGMTIRVPRRSNPWLVDNSSRTLEKFWSPGSFGQWLSDKSVGPVVTQHHLQSPLLSPQGS